MNPAGTGRVLIRSPDAGVCRSTITIVDHKRAANESTSKAQERVAWKKHTITLQLSVFFLGVQLSLRDRRRLNNEFAALPVFRFTGMAIAPRVENGGK